jgi:hypothetical protein
MHSRFCRVRTFIVYIQRIGMLESNKRKMRKIELKRKLTGWCRGRFFSV